MTTTLTRVSAAALAFALTAAGCGDGSLQTASEAPTPETTAAPPATTAEPEPEPTAAGDGCAEAEAETAQGRALMDQAEASGAPPTAEQVEQIAEARWGALFAFGCEGEGVWGDDDEARLDALAAQTDAGETGEAETGEDGNEPDSEVDGAQESGEGEAAAASDEQPADTPTPEMTTAPDPETTILDSETTTAPDPDPETPGAIDFEDEAAPVPEDQTESPQHIAAAALGDPVKLGSNTALLCPDEDTWRSGGFTSCGDWNADGDYLRGYWNTLGDCYHPPVRLGVGDTYTWTSPVGRFNPPLADGTLSQQLVIDGRVLGFSAPDFDGASADGQWAWVQPLVSETHTLRYEMADGTTETEQPWGTVTGTVSRWVLFSIHNWATAEDGALIFGTVATRVPLIALDPIPDPRQC